jgi:hypothetical protein
MLKWIVLFCLIATSCNDADRAKLFDKMTEETCTCSQQQRTSASAAILKCIMQSAEKHDAELKEVGVDGNTAHGFKQIQYEVSVRLESRCREIYMEALKERKVQ